MKNLLIISTGMLYSFIFSYWKFKGPFVTDIHHANGYTTKDTLTHAYNHPFLYDKHTGYFLTVGEKNPTRNYFKTTEHWKIYADLADEQFELLKGNFNYNIHFLNKKYNKYKKLQHLLRTNHINRIRESGPYLGKATLHKYNKYFLKEQIIELFNHMNRRMPWHCFTGLEPIEEEKPYLNLENIYPIIFEEIIKKHPKLQFINSKNGVLLTNGKNTVSFQEALFEYYSGEKTLKQFSQKLETFYHNVSQHTNPIFTTKKEADKLFFPLTKLSLATPKEIRLLQNSQVIAIWGFIPNISSIDDQNQNIIFGLAKDNKTQKQFHWITNLKDDLNVIFSLGSPIKN